MAPKLKNSGKANKSSKNGKSSSYLADDRNFEVFSTQLAKLGLQLRDVTGDGNCCFRALSDQMIGNESQHLDFRKRVCQYMKQNRDEFEPFIAALIDDEDENDAKAKKTSKKLDAFENYIKNLEIPGTYADNASLVAFARLYNLNINIYQLELPIWTINGIKNVNKRCRQLHLSYHNGEHYSSIRRIGDSTNTPTDIYFNDASSNVDTKKPAKASSAKTASNSFYFESDDYEDEIDPNFSYTENMQNFNVEQVMNVTNCHDIGLIISTLNENSNDVQSTIIDLFAQIKLDEQGLSSGGEKSDPKNRAKKQPLPKKPASKKIEKKLRQAERQKALVESKQPSSCTTESNSDVHINSSTIEIKSI